MLHVPLCAARRSVALVALVACTLLSAGLAEQAKAARAPAYSLSVSKHADRSKARPLAGRTFAQPAKIYVFVKRGKRAKRMRSKRVRFYIDDRGRTRRPHRVDRRAPFDLAGAAIALKVSRLSVGLHVVIAAIKMTNGRTRVVTALFAVAPQTASNYSPTRPPAPAPPPLPTGPPSVSVDRSRAVGTSKLNLGVTMSKYSLDSWGNATAIARGQRLLDDAVTFQNQFIYGWGVGNPNPSPGVYDWSRLDARLNVMRGRDNAIPVLTLCGAPDWMTPRGTTTSEFNLQSAPKAAHYDDFAELARRTALRYSSPSSAHPVLYYQVWSELRGLWAASLDNADYVGYTILYNKIYDALKSVNPAIKVGGPYPVLEGDGAGADLGVRLNRTTSVPISPRQKAFLSYWLAHKHGAQFISLDRGGVDFNDTNAYTNAQKFKLIHWYGDIVRQVRALPGYAGEPIWWSEGMTWADDDQRVQRASEAASLRSMMLVGADVMLKWQDQGTYGLGRPVTGFYTDTRSAAGGQPYPSYTAYKLFHDDFPVGTPLYRATSSSAQIEAVASPTKTLLINQSNATHTVPVNGVDVTLSPYEVRTVPV